MILFNKYLKTTQTICLFTVLLQIPSALAQKWFSIYEDKNGFSEFSPPAYITDHNHGDDHDHEYKKHKLHWRSGSSFNDMNRPEYLSSYEQKYSEGNGLNYRYSDTTGYRSANRVRTSHADRNPWRSVNSRYTGQAFRSNRPWGNLPDKKPVKRSNMRLHDQRFKQSLSQQNNFYPLQMGMTNSYMNDAFEQRHVPAAYAYSNSIRHDSLMNTALNNSALINSGGYSNYQSPGGFVPFIANNPGYYGFGNGYYPVNNYQNYVTNYQPW